MYKDRVSPDRSVMEPSAAFVILSLLLLSLLLGLERAFAQAAQSTPAAEADKQDPTHKSLVVDYTGAMFGYYRVEADADPNTGSGMLAPVQAFLAERKNKQANILLGMGNNFGPEFGASVERELAQLGAYKNHLPCYLPVRERKTNEQYYDAPELLYKNEDRLPIMAECDNVGRFLMEAGYSAVVPGREDFLYTATWLRRIAVLFQGANGRIEQVNPFNTTRLATYQEKKWVTDNENAINKDKHKPLMLAANLRVNFTVKVEDPVLDRSGLEKQPLSQQVKGKCPLLFRWGLLGGDMEECAVVSGENAGTYSRKMDWLRRLDLTLDCTQDSKTNCTNGPPRDSKVAESIIEQAKMDAEFRKQLLENQAKIAMSVLDPEILDKSCTLADGNAIGEIKKALKALSDDKSYKKVDDASAPVRFADASTATQLEKLSTMTCNTNEATAKLVQAMNQVVGELSEKFKLLTTDSKQNDKKFLVSSEAREAAVHLLLREIAAEQKDIGYTIVGDGTEGQKTLVIGVIGQETMMAVSPDNLKLCSGYIGLDKPVAMAKLAPCNTKDKDKKDRAEYGHLEGTVKVGDPVLAVTTLTRAAWEECGGTQFCKVVVMAQMPRTEAEELAAQARAALNKIYKHAPDSPHIDLILSEAQEHYITREITLNYAKEDMIPVLTPKLAYSISGEGTVREDLVKPISTVTITPYSASYPVTLPNLSEGCAKKYPPSILLANLRGGDQDRILTNCVNGYKTPEHNPSPCTMAELLETELKSLASAPPESGSNGIPAEGSTGEQSTCQQLATNAAVAPGALGIQSSWETSGSKKLWGRCGESVENDACRNSVMMQYLLEQIHRSSHADVVLLEKRDFYFGEMLKGYDDYQICTDWVSSEDHLEKLMEENRGYWGENKKLVKERAEEYCRVRVALDRVLWKGDYSERVMVDGKTLTQMLTTAQQETDEEQTLAARDTTDEWLMTFGVVTSPPTNLVAASMGTDTFAVPGESFCNDASADAGTPTYCVNGQKVTDDGAYWVSTSDHLANDNAVYKVLKALDPRYHQEKKNLFVTGEIADEIFKHGQKEAILANAKPPAAIVKADDAQLGMSKVELKQQTRTMVQLDYTKLVAGFMIYKPDQSNAQLESNYSGVANSQATTPNSQQLDLEEVSRMTVGPVWQHFRLGIQSDAEYDRAVTGNLTGSPETVTYALNSATVGGFLQYHIRENELLPRLLFVAAPYQYQQQIARNYLYFNYATGTGQITVSNPKITAFNQRLGARYEFGGGKWPKFDAGSYAEGGPEYSVLNNVLSGLQLPNGYLCAASAVSFSTCVAGNTTVSASTVLIPMTETLHAGGAYWDVHLQKALGKAKHFSLTMETKGDNFMLPAVTLPTQARYAFTTDGSFNFSVIGNLVFSPTYTTFFYRNQGGPGVSNALMTNNFSVTAKWYFARDAAVPGRRQIWFQGPASLDQTKTAKMK